MSAHAPPPLPPPARPGWWQRHWKWAVPVLGMSLLLLFALAIGAFMYGIFSMMGKSDVVVEAKRRALQDPRVIEALGSPVEPGWMVGGNISTSGASGNASMHVPLEGPKGEATLYLEAVKRTGRWRYSTLVVVVQGQDADIDLRTPGEAAAATATDEAEVTSQVSGETP